MTYKIFCRRFAGSVFGAATAYAKDIAGKEMTFETREAAEAKADEWNKGLSPFANVRYNVVETT